jgi:hypothetical protein
VKELRRPGRTRQRENEVRPPIPSFMCLAPSSRYARTSLWRSQG